MFVCLFVCLYIYTIGISTPRISKLQKLEAGKEAVCRICDGICIVNKKGQELECVMSYQDWGC